MRRYSQVIGCRSQWRTVASSAGKLYAHDSIAACAGCVKYLAVVAQTNAVGCLPNFVRCSHSAAGKFKDKHLARCSVIDVEPLVVGGEHHMFRTTTNPQVALDEPMLGVYFTDCAVTTIADQKGLTVVHFHHVIGSRSRRHDFNQFSGV